MHVGLNRGLGGKNKNWAENFRNKLIGCSGFRRPQMLSGLLSSLSNWLQMLMTGANAQSSILALGGKRDMEPLEWRLQEEER